ncbi:hypothetical protein ILYODFUR_034336 [Ilyodon furcidens]|uniref:Uncharacterized protein n=1 Tax=Ilyodon furcidens TaxID=33524 RepID=A0ABV0U191_9TELE
MRWSAVGVQGVCVSLKSYLVLVNPSKSRVHIPGALCCLDSSKEHLVSSSAYGGHKRDLKFCNLLPSDNMSAEEATKATEVSPLIPNRMLSPEAQCISRVLENCISQVEIAAALPCTLQFYAGSGAVDEDLSKILQAHQVLEDRLKELQCQKLESDGLQEKETEEAKREMVQLRESIKNSVRDVLRFFRLHPNVLWDLREKINMEVGESERVLIRMLQMFHSYEVKSLTSEKDLQVPQGQQLLFPEQTLEQLITEEENSAAVLKEIDETILKKDSEIKQLERCLKEDHMQAKYKSSCQTKEEQLKLSILRAEVGSLKQTTDQLNMQLSTLIHENRLAERSLQEVSVQFVMIHPQTTMYFTGILCDSNTIGHEREVEGK